MGCRSRGWRGQLGPDPEEKVEEFLDQLRVHGHSGLG